MSDLGLTLAWLAVQESILLTAALALNALASRRGPAPGAQVAALSLGLVVALNVAALVPRVGWNDKVFASEIAHPVIVFENSTSPNTMPSSRGIDVIEPAVTRGRAIEWLGRTWDRLGHRVTEPAARVRSWGRILAGVALAGTATGLLRLVIGLWAVTLCCRRGRRVDDPGMIGLLEELRCAMGCRWPVALREVSDLTTPATAGLRRPVLLLPDHWRSWSAAERRAVLAHELAHTVRGDYATGLLARLAVVLNYFHPLVRWMASRLQLQQEQAADAMGARFAGGPARYLVALSSLALRQDVRSPGWPARAFLPARGTLIRRIAMLRNESNSKPFDRPSSSTRLLLTVFGLLSLTIGVAALRGPARGAADGPSRAAKAEVAPQQQRGPSKSFATPFVRAGVDGAAVIRPAAAFRHPGMERLLSLCQMALDQDFSFVVKDLKVDTSRQGFLKIRCQDIEWFTVGIGFDQSPPPPQVSRTKRNPPNGSGDKPLHRFTVGSLTVRMVAKFDWLAFLRQWRLEFEEARTSGRAYYKITGELTRVLGLNPSVLLLDDRTIVFDEENVIRRIASGEDSAPPAYLRGKEWEHASRGLVAIAINNQNDSFAKRYDLGRSDDTVVLSLFKGLDTWILGVDDADAIALHADGVCRDRDSTDLISRSLDSLIKLGRQFIEQNALKSPDAGAHDQIFRMLKQLAANVHVEHTDNSVAVRTQGFGTLADFAAIIDAEAQQSKARAAARTDAKNSVKK